MSSARERFKTAYEYALKNVILFSCFARVKSLNSFRNVYRTVISWLYCIENVQVFKFWAHDWCTVKHTNLSNWNINKFQSDYILHYLGTQVNKCLWRFTLRWIPPCVYNKSFLKWNIKKVSTVYTLHYLGTLKWQINSKNEITWNVK